MLSEWLTLLFYLQSFLSADEIFIRTCESYFCFTNKLCEVIRSVIIFHIIVPVNRVLFEFAHFMLSPDDRGRRFLLLRDKCIFGYVAQLWNACPANWTAKPHIYENNFSILNQGCSQEVFSRRQWMLQDSGRSEPKREESMAPGACL